MTSYSISNIVLKQDIIFMTTDLHPENHLHDMEPRWFAISTRFKREKVVVKALTKQGIHAYLPLQKLLRQYGRKKRWVELPLFTSYVFVKIVKKEYVPVLATLNVVQFIRFAGNLISIPEKEIQMVQRIVGEGIPLEVEQGHFVEGDTVEISTGNLAGLRGTLIQESNKGNSTLR